ncbi:MAG: hypothetical protein EPO55_13390 [Reyranella sp.]|uniref:hypothetical protein n=1 Tax=Reyranella sp. TaxID=1929291 RepID=UPI001216CFAA|nr:hypothetical protein [Reyranella sp.]TAJ39106.1 MAG: hypothetical protein EPO55_13390 [Reyranella sp.]
MILRISTAVSVGLLATACQSPQQARYATPAGYPATYATSEQACVDYGFSPGTAGYNSCVSRERAARTSGRVSADYAEVNLTRDAQDACYSYGLQPRTDRFDRCVGREIDARRYRSEASVQTYPPYRTDQYGYRVDAQGYRVDASGYRISPPPVYAAASYPVAYAPAYVEPRPTTTGEVAFRDEFGFRYDTQGNRIDARGNIISPQTRTP